MSWEHLFSYKCDRSVEKTVAWGVPYSEFFAIHKYDFKHVVLAAVLMIIVVLWHVTSCSLVDVCQQFPGTYCFHIFWR